MSSVSSRMKPLASERNTFVLKPSYDLGKLNSFSNMSTKEKVCLAVAGIGLLGLTVFASCCPLFLALGFPMGYYLAALVGWYMMSAGGMLGWKHFERKRIDMIIDSNETLQRIVREDKGFFKRQIEEANTHLVEYRNRTLRQTFTAYVA